MSERKLLIVAVLLFLLSLVGGTILDKRQEEETRRLAIQAKFCKDGWGEWKPCQ